MKRREKYVKKFFLLLQIISK